MPVRAFEVRREEIDEEIKDVRAVGVVLQVKEIDGKDALKHIVQEVVLFVLFGKAGVDTQACIADADKAHDVTRYERVFALDGEDRTVLDLVRAVAEALREHEQRRIAIKLDVLDGHSCQRA